MPGMTSWTLTFADENGEFIADDNAEILTETSNVFDAEDEVYDDLSMGDVDDIDDIPVYVFGEQVGGYRINANSRKISPSALS